MKKDWRESSYPEVVCVILVLLPFIGYFVMRMPP